MTAGSILLGLSSATFALAQSLPVDMLDWLLIDIGMGEPTK
jgi:hypothetical protein